MGNLVCGICGEARQNWEDFMLKVFVSPQSPSLYFEGVEFESDFEIIKELGEGGFSKVFEAKHRRNHERYAVKSFYLGNREDEPELLNLIRFEVQTMQRVRHPGVVQVFAFYEEPDRFLMIMELMEGGELFDRIVSKYSYNESEARDLIRILLTTVLYIHQQKIAHRDLKPENLLLLSRANDYQVKIADFGFAASVEHSLCSDAIGTPGYVAPEVLKGKFYSLPVDIWSLGVIFFILLSGHPPFHDVNQRKLYRKIKNGAYSFSADEWNSVSDEAKDLVGRMLTVDPDDRITAQEALMHPWLISTRYRPDLLRRNLTRNLEKMRIFNARNKFRGAIKSVIFANKINNLIRVDFRQPTRFNVFYSSSAKIVVDSLMLQDS